MNVTKYRFGNRPDLLPLAYSPDGEPIEGEWPSDRVIRKAGFNPADEELSVTILGQDWDGHPAGSLVLLGLTVEGHPFAIVEQ